MESMFSQVEYLNFISFIFYVILSFICIHFLSISKNINSYFKQKFGKKTYSLYKITFIRILAFLLYGIIPFFILFFNKNVELVDFGLNFKNKLTNIWWVFILCLILVSLNYFNRKKSDNLKLYPQIRNKEWSIKLVIISSLGWVLYLCAYEFMFRGFLLYGSLYAFGKYIAILINIGIYSLAHIPKGKKEAFGAIPFGLVLCLLTLQSGNILAAFLIHITIALSNEWLTLSIHPTIHLIHKKIKRI